MSLETLLACSSVSCFVSLAWTFCNERVGGMLLPILFVLCQVIIGIKVRNTMSLAIVGIIFLSIFAFSTELSSASYPILIAIAVFELALILYNFIFR